MCLIPPPRGTEKQIIPETFPQPAHNPIAPRAFGKEAEREQIVRHLKKPALRNRAGSTIYGQSNVGPAARGGSREPCRISSVSQSSGGNAAAFIFVTVMLDATGIGIIVPVTPDLIAELTSLDISGAALWG
ncbi:MAG: hypothetical protein K8F25_08030, partial [Fimbriimonadaceae bacterium]|nr:hypothetical protein [Alphaproteobacteria bacterium]